MEDPSGAEHRGRFKTGVHRKEASAVSGEKSVAHLRRGEQPMLPGPLCGEEREAIRNVQSLVILRKQRKLPRVQGAEPT